MFCSSCGTQLPDGSRFCISCGAPVVPQPSRDGSAAPLPKTKTAPLTDAQPPARENPGKGPQCGRHLKRKKTPLGAIAAGVILCLIILSVVIINPFANRKAAWNKYATVGDLSEVSWYLQDACQIDDLTTCQFYDYFEMMEASYIFVRLPSVTDEVQDGRFLAFGYDMSWCDTGGKCYAGCPAIETSRKELGTTDSGATILQITLVMDAENDPYSMDAVVAQNDSGQIESLLASCVLNEYSYNRAGQVEQISISEARTASWDTMDNFEDCYLTNSVMHEFDVDFTYNKDGSLSGTNKLLSEESEPWLIFTYEDGERTRVEDTGCMPPVQCVVSFERDEDGRVSAYNVESKNGEPVNKYVQFYYLPDGKTDTGMAVYGN